jgi:hypothetical protein
MRRIRKMMLVRSPSNSSIRKEDLLAAWAILFKSD